MFLLSWKKKKRAVDLPSAVARASVAVPEMLSCVVNLKLCSQIYEFIQFISIFLHLYASFIKKLGSQLTTQLVRGFATTIWFTSFAQKKKISPVIDNLQLLCFL